jgi:ABC-type dipeptide/oligopeptide/nickel transport system permease component
MARYCAGRLLSALPTALGVATIVFALLHVMPGDPVEVMLGERATVADHAALRHELGLDRPLLDQYLGYLNGLAHGDLGKSIHGGRSVAALIGERAPATLTLALAATLAAIALALPLGVAAARHPHGAIDRLSLSASLLGVAIPNFWLGPMLIIAFAIQLRWLPVSGSGSWPHLVLPAVTLGASMAGLLTRMTRTTVLETLHEDYIRTARAKGLDEHSVLWRHALRNAATPILSLVGLELGGLLAGSVITETIFAWPGLGRLLVDAIYARDYPVVQGCVLVIAAGYVTITLATDLAYAVVNPRARAHVADAR